MIYLSVLGAALLIVGTIFLLFAARSWADTSCFLGPFTETGDWIRLAKPGCAFIAAALVCFGIFWMLGSQP